MNGFKSSLAQIISTKLCNQLTSNMDFKVLKLKFEKERDEKSVQQALSYSQLAVEKLRELINLKPQQIEVQHLNKTDTRQKKDCFGMGRKVSILKIKKNSQTCQKIIENSKKTSKKLIRLKQSQKGLVKLRCQQNQLLSFTQYIDKLRQKKIKLAQVMQQLNKDPNQKQNLKQLKPKARQANSIDQAFITTFTGELVKCQKKEVNSKRDQIYLDKIKIKPLYKLREHVSSRADLNKISEKGMQLKRVSISKQIKDPQEHMLREENSYIKSVIQDMTNRKKQEAFRRRRINLQ